MNTRKRIFLGLGAILAFALSIIVISQSLRLAQREKLREVFFRGAAWFKFDRETALRGWEEKIFKGRVLYSVKVGRTDGYLDAYSQSAASAIIYHVKFDPKKAPLVSWKWKVIKFPERKGGADAQGNWIEKDDYAARVYVIFPRFPFFRLQCLEYIWDRDLPKEAILTNKNFTNLKLIVAESGEANLGKWVYEERNIYQDFKKAFGREPGTVGAVAIMTDAENTASIAAAQYDEIKVGYEKQ